MWVCIAKYFFSNEIYWHDKILINLFIADIGDKDKREKCFRGGLRNYLKGSLIEGYLYFIRNIHSIIKYSISPLLRMLYHLVSIIYKLPKYNYWKCL